MAVSTVTSKGQITIPKEIRDRLKLMAGHRVEFYVANKRRGHHAPSQPRLSRTERHGSSQSEKAGFHKRNERGPSAWLLEDMKGLHTNVLVRYLTADDARQTPLAEQVLEQTVQTGQPLFVPMVVLCELTWVLSKSYGRSRAQITAVLQRILETEVFVDNVCAAKLDDAARADLPTT